MAAIQFTPADRDDQGFIKAAAPRSLADLLPPVAAPADPTIRRQPLTTAELATVIALGLLLLGLLAYLWSGQKATSAPLPQATAILAPTVAPATPAAPTPVPVAMLPVFASPGAEAFNQIEASRLITVTGHYNASWIQIDAGGRAGRVWVRASDAPQLALQGPNLAPTTQIQITPADLGLTPEQLAEILENARRAQELADLNDPAKNGNNLAPPGCPFPIINGICGNGVRAKDVPDVPARKSVKAGP